MKYLNNMKTKKNSKSATAADLHRWLMARDNSYAISVINKEPVDVARQIVKVISLPFNEVTRGSKSNSKPIIREFVLVKLKNKEVCIILNDFYL
jgi:hypothetical protein